ncbi:MAG TPA: DUF1269 domain-containing protein [Chthonomonadaceae bacterium]|nr:DUF1269 domain-containing protein [Chthonomonadaceae bacterium]
MSKFIVAIFPNEKIAYDGTQALKELDAEGSLTLYSMAVVTQDTDGKLSVKQAADEGPLGTAVGSLTGGLIGLLGGPVGMAVGFAGGALVGSWGDLFHLGVSSKFLEEVSQKLTPGKVAVVADIDEDWITPLDTRMDALGGIVVREWRTDFEEELYEREVNSRKAEVAQLRTEFAQAREENKAKLRARIEEAQTRLQDTMNQFQARVEQRQQEIDARIQTLQARAAKARSDAKARHEKRNAELQADYERRSTKLKQALALTKEALAP